MSDATVIGLPSGAVPAWAMQLLRDVAEIKTRVIQPQANAGDTSITSTAAMNFLGYKDRSAFWAMVRREGIPHTRINARQIVFELSALKAWKAKRTIGRVRP